MYCMTFTRWWYVYHHSDNLISAIALLRHNCHEGWHVYEINQKNNHDWKISYVKIGNKIVKTKM